MQWLDSSESIAASEKYLQLHCFRIVQEALANIEKHAGAAEVLVLVRANAAELLICVTDNGRGFSPPDRDSCHKLRAQGHYGLWNMYERAASIGGTLVIDSEAGEGTVLTLRVPLRAGNAS
jgi:signal transduction histidine kinase